MWHNDSAAPRVVLIVDVWHPEMSERQRVACLDDKELERYLYHRDRCTKGLTLGAPPGEGPLGAVCAGWFESSRHSAAPAADACEVD